MSSVETTFFLQCLPGILNFLVAAGFNPGYFLITFSCVDFIGFLAAVMTDCAV